MTIETVTGRHTRILFDAKKCIHSRHCVLGRPDVFVPNVAGEWIHPDAATPAELAELAHQCPSGAIRVEPLDGSPAEQPPLVNLAHVRENGPLAFHADMHIGNEEALRATLCRCGASGNKPYCDGSHAKAGFVASGEPATAESTVLAVRNGALRITPTPDGPLHAEGPLELVSGTGRTLNRGTDAWLCRCGHSGNKPYCDGSHKNAGFKAP
jgi:CDGSH-type Zn-finger protein/uncharacterized Fe-S cluster protein YjdI